MNLGPCPGQKHIRISGPALLNFFFFFPPYQTTSSTDHGLTDDVPNTFFVNALRVRALVVWL